MHMHFARKLYKQRKYKIEKYGLATIKYTRRSRLWLFWLQPAAPGYNFPDLQHRNTHTYANEIVLSSIKLAPGFKTIQSARKFYRRS